MVEHSSSHVLYVLRRTLIDLENDPQLCAEAPGFIQHRTILKENIAELERKGVVGIPGPIMLSRNPGEM